MKKSVSVVKLNRFLVIVLFTYLVIFAAFAMHRTSSGYRREVKANNKFKKFLNIKKEIENQNSSIYYSSNTTSDQSNLLISDK